MKIQNLAYGWCILALLTACQARQVQTKNGVKANLSGNQTGQSTVLDAKVPSNDGKTEIQATPTAALQFQKIGVVASDASLGYNITAAENGTFMISVSLYQGKVMNTSFSIDTSAGKTYQAVSDLMTGSLVLQGKTDAGSASTAATATEQVTLTNLSGATNVVNDPASADSNVASALKAIHLYIDERLPETVTELRPTAQTCETIDLAGVWISNLVSGSQVIRVTSTIQAGQATNGTVAYSGTDEANGKSRTMSYQYTPSSCMLQKSTQGQQARTFKIIFVGQSSRQIVKLLPCEDQACTRTMENPGYTDMVILRRAK